MQEALDRGRTKEHGRLVAKPHEQVMEDDVTAVIFALGAWHAYREGEHVEGSSTNVHVNINLPSALTSKGYLRLLDAPAGSSSQSL